MKLWKIEYKVIGSFKHMHSFPLDMLRYDNSIPKSLDDWNLIIQSHVNIVIPTKPILSIPINLIHYSHGNKNWSPTLERWDSFTWNVLNIRPPIDI